MATVDATHLPPVLTRYPGYLLRFVADRATERFDAALADEGLRGRHVEALAVILDEGAMSQRQLGRRLRVDKSQMVTLVDDLERIGLARRRRSPTDRRVQDVHLTPAGEQTVGRALDIGEQLNAETFAALDEQETKTLHGLLLRLAGG